MSSSDFSNFQNKINFLELVMDYCFTILALPLGALLNIIAAFIFRRRNLNKTNMGFFYFWISVFNAFTLLFYLFVVESDLFLDYDLSTVNDVSCKVVFLIKRATRPLVPWFLVLLSLERFVSLKFRNKSCYWRKESYLCLILAILIFLILSSTANLYFFVDHANTTLIERLNATFNETKVALTPASCESSRY